MAWYVRARSLDNAGPASARGVLEKDGRGLIEGGRRFYPWILVHAVQERRRPDADDLAVRLVPGNRLARVRRYGLLRRVYGDHDVGHGAVRRVGAPPVPRLLQDCSLRPVGPETGGRRRDAVSLRSRRSPAKLVRGHVIRHPRSLERRHGLDRLYGAAPGRVRRAGVPHGRGRRRLRDPAPPGPQGLPRHLRPPQARPDRHGRPRHHRCALRPGAEVGARAPLEVRRVVSFFMLV
mmetsp:Transcript_19255/g.59402  ORF Transcript_19255/g.59402 Transcript_19255/m.59402 type:complete len:235 (+) Transcript_19255:843-1547(+)